MLAANVLIALIVISSVDALPLMFRRPAATTVAAPPGRKTSTHGAEVTTHAELKLSAHADTDSRTATRTESTRSEPAHSSKAEPTHTTKSDHVELPHTTRAEPAHGTGRPESTHAPRIVSEGSRTVTITKTLSMPAGPTQTVSAQCLAALNDVASANCADFESLLKIKRNAFGLPAFGDVSDADLNAKAAAACAPGGGLGQCVAAITEAKSACHELTPKSWSDLLGDVAAANLDYGVALGQVVCASANAAGQCTADFVHDLPHLGSSVLPLSGDQAAGWCKSTCIQSTFSVYISELAPRAFNASEGRGGAGAALAKANDQLCNSQTTVPATTFTDAQPTATARPFADSRKWSWF